MKQDRFKRVAKEKEPIFEVFLKALTEHYSSDALAPGIVVAWLPEQRVFYCSVRRYTTQPVVMRVRPVVQARAKTAKAAIVLAMKKWKAEMLRPQQSHLDMFMEDRGTAGLDAHEAWMGGA